MKKISEKLIALFVAVAMLPACSDDTVDLLNENHYVGVSSELYSGLWGLVADVAKVADQAPILEGLRGGMLEPTENATSEMVDIYKYADLHNNKIANPDGFYFIINSVDDYVKRVDEFRKTDSTALDFEHQYNVTFDLYISTAVRYKVWAYMQLAKLYGGAKVKDETNPEGTWKDFDQVIDHCIYLMTNKVTYGSNGMTAARWRNFLAPDPTITDNRDMQRYDCYQFTPWTLLAELYLWDRDYTAAYRSAADELENAGFIGGCYTISFRAGNYGQWKKLFRCSDKEKSGGSEYLRIEVITNASYSPRQGECDRLTDYASFEYPNHYYVRPTLKAMARFDTISVSDKGDSNRGRNGTFTRRYGDNNPELLKWIDVAASGRESEDINIAIYRAAQLHLMLCESFTGMALETNDAELQGAYIECALALINNGIVPYWDGANNAYKGCFAKLKDFPTTLYDNSSTSSDNLTNKGIRQRVSVGPVGTEFVAVDTLGEYTMPMDMVDRIWKVDSLVCEEAFFELSGEGHVMPIFYRMMRHWYNYDSQNQPDKLDRHKEFFVKFIAAGRSDIEDQLNISDPTAPIDAETNKWFINYKLD